MTDLPLLTQTEYDMLKQERDTAMKQLHEIGAVLGDDMKDYRKVIHSQWKDMGDAWSCKHCGSTQTKHVTQINNTVYIDKPLNYCSWCGAKMDGVEERPRCNMCGKELEEYDLDEDLSFEHHCGYGSKYDLEVVKMQFCCDCFDKFIDDLISRGKISPIVGEYD